MPGQPGNFALASRPPGGNGAPFNDLDRLESCDVLVAQTRDTWFEPRLPFNDVAVG